jgi:hypothetical protein
MPSNDVRPSDNQNLKLVLRKIKLTDESLSCFSDSPFLEKPEIWDSVGLQKPIILVVEVLIVNCPNLRTLETCMIQDLRVNWGVVSGNFLCGPTSYNAEGKKCDFDLIGMG